LVADKIDKKVLLNFAPVVNDVRAEKMAQRLADEINKDVVNPDTIEFIKSKVTKDMSGTVKEEIKTALQAKTEDITLRRTIASTVDRIFQERGNLSSTIATTEDFHVGLANIIDEKNVTAELVESLKKLSQNHNLVLNRENIGLYLDDILKDRKLVGHCDTQVRDRVYAQLDRYSPRILDVKELDDGKKWQYSIGGVDVPYTSYEDAKAHMKDDYKITDYRDELQKYIDKETGRPQTFFVDETFDDRLVISINWGDWKHEHGYADYLVKKFFMDKGLGIEVEEEITDEDGSDTYSADHYYDINDVSFSGRVVSESKSTNESEGNHFKVGDTFTHSGLYGGTYDSTVKSIDGNKLNVETTWTSEDDGSTQKDDGTYELTTDGNGKECIVVWEYNGEKGYVYPESHNGKDEIEEPLSEAVIDDKALKEIKWIIDGILDCEPEKGLDADGLKFLHSRARYMKKVLDSDNGLEESLSGYKLNITKGAETFDDYCYDYSEDGAKRQMNNKYGKDITINSIEVHNKEMNEASANNSEKLNCKEFDDKKEAERFAKENNGYYEPTIDDNQKTTYNVFYKENDNLQEASYGGAFDIEDDQYFTRDDLNDFAEEVLNHINETFKTPFDVSSCYIDNGILELCVTNDEYGDYIYSEKIDMRKIKEPWHLKRAYAFEFASQLINDITRSNDGLIESVVSSSYEFDDDIDELTYYYDDEELKDALTDIYEEIASKQVMDSDGFMTDYTMYRNINTGEYVFVFGDKDIYRPEDGYFDWECETEDEAKEWFDNYEGFDYDDDDWMNEEVEEQSPIIHKKGDGSYLIASPDGGYTAFNRSDVCMGHISAENETEAKNKFNSNKFDENLSK